MVHLCHCGNESKYCCPRCNQRTCSLACVKAHKDEKNCSGIADKAAFVKLSNFDNMQLVSDYKFLENIKESLGNSHRHLQPNYHGQNTLGMIRKKCIANETLIKFMPQSFSRHTINQSCFKDDQVKWTIELVFADRNKKILAHHIEESLTIEDLMNRYKGESVQHSEYRFVSMYLKGNPDIFYLIKADVGESNSFHRLDPGVALTESLKYKRLIEFPTIFITSNPESFKIVECEKFNVREEMVNLGLINDGKRKRNNKRRSQKRQKKSRGQANTSGGDNSTSLTETMGASKKNPFKDSVLALFASEEENKAVCESDEKIVSEEGEID